MTDLIALHIDLLRCIYAHKTYVIKLIYKLSFCILQIPTLSESSFAIPPNQSRISNHQISLPQRLPSVLSLFDSSLMKRQSPLPFDPFLTQGSRASPSATRQRSRLIPSQATAKPQYGKTALPRRHSLGRKVRFDTYQGLDFATALLCACLRGCAAGKIRWREKS